MNRAAGGGNSVESENGREARLQKNKSRERKEIKEESKNKSDCRSCIERIGTEVEVTRTEA